MLSFNEQVKLGVSLVEWSVDKKDLQIKDLIDVGVSGVYIYEPIMGGKSICVTSEGDVLLGCSAQSFESLVEDLKNGKRTEFKSKKPSNIQEVKCPKCGNVTRFDTKKVPIGVKFDYKCSQCGVFHLIKLTDPSKEVKNTQKEIKYFHQKIFTIENLKDPELETKCQKLADEVIEKLLAEGKSVRYILVVLNALKDESSIRKFLISNDVKLPEASDLRNSLLEIFSDKLQNVQKRLDEMT